MNKLKLFSLYLILVFSLFACKKDFPSDIPQWVKAEIVKCKRGSCCDLSGNGWSIGEYINKKNQQKIYVFQKSNDGMSCKEYYDYDGNLICYHNIVYCPGDSCGNIPIVDLNYSRGIWSESKEKCK